MLSLLSFFFFNDTATTEIYTLSLHDALPISNLQELETARKSGVIAGPERVFANNKLVVKTDRKSTRLNSSHQIISYAVFCLKKKKLGEDRVHVTRTVTSFDTDATAVESELDP